MFRKSSLRIAKACQGAAPWLLHFQVALVRCRPTTALLSLLVPYSDARHSYSVWRNWTTRKTPHGLSTEFIHTERIPTSTAWNFHPEARFFTGQSDLSNPYFPKFKPCHKTTSASIAELAWTGISTCTYDLIKRTCAQSTWPFLLNLRLITYNS